MSLGTIMYIHTNFNDYFAFEDLLQELPKILDFLLVITPGCGASYTQNFVFKKLYEDLHYKFENHHIYSHHFQHRIYRPFVGIIQHFQFSCVITHRSGTWSNQIFFFKKLYKKLCNELWNHHYTNTIFITCFNIDNTFYRNYPKFQIFRVFQPINLETRAPKLVFF